MWFGEELTIAQARHQIASSPKRSEFLFGANCFAADRGIPRYRELYSNLLNFGTVPFYLASYEPEEGKVQSGRATSSLEFLKEYGLKAKGHPLVWFFRGCWPTWTDDRSYEEIREIVRKRVERDVTAFREGIKIWDVINEAHDWANCYGYDGDQLIELTRVAAEATRSADPEAIRIVNCCCVFGEYAAAGQGHDRHPPREVMTPHQYVERLLEEKVDFEVLGLQLYYTMFDLFEHKRLFDRFARFGLPIHVTEVAVPSSMEGDPNAHNKDPNAIKNLGVWRRPWDPETQAEWVEAFYTICYAHPAVEAVTWWDFSDATPHFFPRGGFQDENAEPKPSYFALQKLFREWGFLEPSAGPGSE
jgi:GH35 family endo-1,4-beta-xylanase